MKGAIIGDTIGSVYEFNNIHTTDFPIYTRHSHFTDDSVMTIAVAASLMDGLWKVSPNAYKASLVSYMKKIGRPYPHTGYGGNFKYWLYSDSTEPYNSMGNGSAMRVSPVAYVVDSIEQCEALAKLTAEVTHNHPDGIAGAQATAGATYLALHGATKNEIKKYVEKFYSLDFTIAEIADDYEFSEINETTVPPAIEAFLEGENFEDCIRIAVALGGDTDTVCAITGAVAGAFYDIPDELWFGAYDRLSHTLVRYTDRFLERFGK